jgi:exopolyphosphatase/guanosine-5'-triphosphate,3'-diphosphate pyrophosphatase
VSVPELAGNHSPLFFFSKQSFDTVAAVDLGSNSFHMIVARLRDGGIEVIDSLREMVRLGGGLDEVGNLDQAARDRALACLERFGQRVRPLVPGSVRAVGTNTLRQARNAAGFLQQAETALGHPIEIISGTEEARLIYLGVAHDLAGDESRRLVMDIGGGSTELIIGKLFEPLHMRSLHMGCVSMSRRFFDDGCITDKRWRRAITAARLELEPHEAVYRHIGWREVVGASGTIRAVGQVVMENGWCQHGITRDALDQLVQVLLDAGRLDKLKLPGLVEERVPVFPGGVAILAATFDALGIETMEVADGALREGLLYDLIGRIRHEDTRIRTIQGLAGRYEVDTRQAALVKDTVVDFLNQVGSAWSLEGVEVEDLLQWAADIHEMGLQVARSGYHKHGAYLLDNADLPGFSRKEQHLLALLVRLHRRKLVKELFDDLPDDERKTVERMVILLRLAVLLHRSRSEVPLPEINIKAKKRSIALKFPPGWFDEHPLTQADLEEEAGYLKALGHTLTYV